MDSDGRLLNFVVHISKSVNLVDLEEKVRKLGSELGYLAFKLEAVNGPAWMERCQSRSFAREHVVDHL